MLPFELERQIRLSIDQRWAKHKGTMSHERYMLLGEIDRLRADLDEQCRLLGMSGEMEAKLLAKIDRLQGFVATVRSVMGSADADISEIEDALTEIE